MDFYKFVTMQIRMMESSLRGWGYCKEMAEWVKCLKWTQESYEVLQMKEEQDGRDTIHSTS